MITHECSRRNITIKQPEIDKRKIILQFETFAKASQIMDFLSSNGGTKVHYFHNPSVEKFKVEIAVVFESVNPMLFTLLNKYLGINLWEILPDELAPSDHPINTNS